MRRIVLLILLLLPLAAVAQSPFSNEFRKEVVSLLRQGGRSETDRVVTSGELYQLFQHPTNEYRPFVRWWWNGDKVDSAELCRELRLLREAGIGGVEINPIEFPRRCDSVGIPSLTWLSDPWVTALKSALDEAQRLDMQCDLLVGSGWPFGNEQLPMEDRAQVMLTYAVELVGGDTITLLKKDIFRAIDPQVTVANPDRTFELVSLTLTPDSISSLDQAKDVSSCCRGDSIQLALPKGRYVLYCLVKCRSFASVINGAPGASGPILDHLNADAVARYLDQMSGILEAHLGPMKVYLRGYFVDSMELEGSNWTSDFAEQFLRRRGYDLMPYMPLISFKVGRLGEVSSYQYGARKSPDFEKQLRNVRRDYEITKAELFHERYTQTFLDWCRRQGVKSRAQAYGRGFFPYESSLGFDIPEGESWTTNYLRHRVGEEMPDEDYRRGRAYTMIDKYVSSAAHLMGRREVSAEEMTNTYRVFHTSLELLKLGSDMSAISGITHSVWHGFNYNPPEAGFPGWVQYGSYYSEQNPWWPFFRCLNDYRARTSVLLQHGELQSRIAILLPTEQLWGECGVQTEPFPNYPKGSIYEVPQLLWEAVHKCGANCDFISRSVLDQARVKDGKLLCGAKTYDYLLTMDLDSIGAKSPVLQRLKRKGKVVEVPNSPDRDYLSWYAQKQSELNLPHDVEILRPDRFLLQNHLMLDDGSHLFHLVNAHIDQPLADTLVFPQEIWRDRTLWIYDANEGVRYRLPIQEGRLPISLGPAESLLLVFNFDTMGFDYPPVMSQQNTFSVNKDWTITLRHSVTGQVDTLCNRFLRDFAKDSLFDDFMGTITYQTTIELDSNIMPSTLHLGMVCHIAELQVNGHDCGLCWFGDPIFDISEAIRPGFNTIEVKVTTLMGNYMRTLADNKVVQNFVLNRKVPPVSLGLIGPVKLW